MKVAVWIDKNYRPETGGGYSYYNKLVKSIDEYQFDSSLDICFVSENLNNDVLLSRPVINLQHKFYLLKIIIKIVKVIPILRQLLYNRFNKIKKNKVNELYKKILESFSIDIIFYIRQMECVILNYPFIATNWDIGHRSTFAFPELSGNGNFESRNEFYTLTLPKALMIFVESEAGKKELIKYTNITENIIKVTPIFAGDCVNVCVNEVKQTSFLERYGLETHNYFFYPAQFWAHKNHANVLKAFSKFIHNHPDCKIVFTGSDKGNLDYIKNFTSKLNIEKNVLYLGFVSTEEINILYLNAIALVMASFFGPTNMPPIEAMELACPVICSDIEGHHEILNDSAVYFNPISEQEIYDAMVKILNDNNYYRSKIKLQKEKSKFNIDYTMNEMNKYLTEAAIIRSCWK